MPLRDNTSRDDELYTTITTQYPEPDNRHCEEKSSNMELTRLFRCETKSKVEVRSNIHEQAMHVISTLRGHVFDVSLPNRAQPYASHLATVPLFSSRVPGATLVQSSVRSCD